MIQRVEFSRKTKFGNTRKVSAYMVNETGSWDGAGYKSAAKASIFDWFVSCRKLNANYVPPVQEKLI